MKLDEKFLSCYTKRWPRVKKFKKTLPKYFNNKKRRKLFKVRQYYAKFKKTGDPRTAKIERAEFCEIMQVVDQTMLAIWTMKKPVSVEMIKSLLRSATPAPTRRSWPRISSGSTTWTTMAPLTFRWTKLTKKLVLIFQEFLIIGTIISGGSNEEKLKQIFRWEIKL